MTVVVSKHLSAEPALERQLNGAPTQWSAHSMERQLNGWKACLLHQPHIHQYWEHLAFIPGWSRAAPLHCSKVDTLSRCQHPAGPGAPCVATSFGRSVCAGTSGRLIILDHNLALLYSTLLASQRTHNVAS